MSNNININDFNKFLNLAAESIICGPDCQREKTAETLRQKVINAKTNQVMAPYNIETSIKNYITYTRGEAAYDEYNEAKLTRQANEISASIQNSFKENADITREMAQQYFVLFNNFENVLELYSNYFKKNKELEKEIKKMDSDILTNNRKTYYEDQQIDVLNSYYYFFIIIYIIIWILFFIFIFIFPSKLTRFKLFGIAFLLLIYPFIATPIFLLIYRIYYSITRVLPKNVYKNISE